MTARALTTMFLVSVLAAAASVASADSGGRPGSPAKGFGNRGLAVADLSTNKRGPLSNYTTDAVIDRRGRIILSGQRRARDYESILVAFKPNGKIDRSWGRNGTISHRFTARGDFTDRGIYAGDVTIGPRGIIYSTDVVNLVRERDWRALAKDQEGDPEPEEIEPTRVSFYIYAHSPSGRPVRSFGENGRVRVTATRDGKWQDGGLEQVYDIVVSRSGSIYMLYRENAWYIRLLKIKPNGQIDRKFGRYGRKTIYLQSNMDSSAVEGARLFMDGSRPLAVVPVTEHRDQGGNPRMVWMATRFTPGGKRDGGYGTNGTKRYMWPGGTSLPEDYTTAFYAIRDRRGRLVMGGWSYYGESLRGRVVRLDRSGQLDKSFGKRGVARLTDPSGTNLTVEGITQTSDGSYVIATWSCTDDECTGGLSSRLLSQSGQLRAKWANGGLGDHASLYTKLTGIYAHKDRVYQVPNFLRTNGSKKARMAIMALNR